MERNNNKVYLGLLFARGKVGALNILINFFVAIKNCNILIIAFSCTYLFTFTILSKFKSLNMASPFPTNNNPGNFLLLAIISLPGLYTLVGYFSIK